MAASTSTLALNGGVLVAAYGKISDVMTYIDSGTYDLQDKTCNIYGANFYSNTSSTASMGIVYWRRS